MFNNQCFLKKTCKEEKSLVYWQEKSLKKTCKEEKSGHIAKERAATHLAAPNLPINEENLATNIERRATYAHSYLKLKGMFVIYCHCLMINVQHK